MLPGARRIIRVVLLASIVLVVTAATSTAKSGVVPPATPPDQAKSATLLFIPGPLRTPEPVLTADLERLPGFSVGLMSPTIGRYSPTQMMLDISQGARVATSLYKPVTPQAPGLVYLGGSAVFDRWDPLVVRADAVPGDIVPGLLGQTVRDGGLDTTWVGAAGSPTLSAVAAADQGGRVADVSLAKPGELADEIAAAQRRSSFVVAALPAGGAGLAAIKDVSADDPGRLIIVVQSPPDPARTRLLSVAVRGVGGDGGLTSATTRRSGLIATTDVAATVIQRLGLKDPDQLQGQPIEGAAKQTSAQLVEMNARLSLVAGRRAPLGRSVIVIGGIALILLLLAGRITGRYDETARLAQRLTGLALLWLPLMLLVTAALRPSQRVEADVAIVGSLLLAFVTDRVVRWPRALWVPVAAVVIAHGLDFLLQNGEYTGESLLGSNPLYGARFFGVGNELETVLTVSAVMATGSALCSERIRKPAWWFAGAGAALALYLGAGRIGADVGGVIFAGAAFGVAAVYVAKMRFTPLRVAALIALPFIGLALIAVLDAVTGGESHLTRSVVDANGVGDLWKIADRRFSASINGAKSDGIWIIVIVSLALLAWAWLKRERLFARLTEGGEDPAFYRPLRAGMVGGLAGTVIGALANDSGPAILIIGTIYLGMGLLYLRGRPVSGTIKE